MAVRVRRGPDLEVYPDPCPDLLVERGPEGKGVGDWVPKQKHKLLCDYLYATAYFWKKWPRHVLIDPFCGPGRIQVRGEEFTREGGTVLAWRTLASTAPFSSVLIGDIDQRRVEANMARLTAVGAPVRGFVGPASQTIRDMAESVPNRSLCLAYVDPYNLRHLSFSILEALAKLRVDLAVNFSTMDLQRNVDFESDPDRAGFDESAPGWREHLNKAGTSRSGMSNAFFQYWRDLVSGLGFEHCQEMPLVFNAAGSAIYRMVMFTHDDRPKRVWNDVARGPNRDFGF